MLEQFFYKEGARKKKRNIELEAVTCEKNDFMGAGSSSLVLATPQGLWVCLAGTTRHFVIKYRLELLLYLFYLQLIAFKTLPDLDECFLSELAGGCSEEGVI